MRISNLRLFLEFKHNLLFSKSLKHEDGSLETEVFILLKYVSIFFDVQVKNRAFLRFSVCRHSPDFRKKKCFLNSHNRNDEIDK